MKPTLLKASNFCSLGEVSLDLADRGLVLVLGDNKDGGKADSNGSGKSLLFDAFCWCLWGNTIRGIKGDKVVSRTAKKNCVVSLDFEDEGKVYKVIRHQADKKHGKANDLEFFLDDNNITSNSIAETQEIINNVIGMDFDIFRSMQPGSGLKAAELTDKNIKELLEGILQTETLSKAQKLANEKSKELGLELKTLQNSLSIHASNLQAQKATLDEYKRKHETFQSDISESVKKAKVVVSQLLQVVAEDKEKLVQETKKHIKFKSLEEEYTKIKKYCHEVDKVQREIETNHDTKITNVKVLQGQYSSKKKDLVERRASFLKVGSTCSMCNQSVGEDHIHKELELLDESIRKTTEGLAAIEKSLEDQRAKRAEELEDLAHNMKGHKERARELEALMAIKPLPIPVLENALARSKQSHQDAEKRIEELLEMKPPFGSLIEGAEEKIDSLSKTIYGINQDITRVEKMKEVYEFWIDGFSPKGLRSQMLKFVTPILNDRAANYCDILTDGEMNITFETESLLKNGNVKDDFNIVVTQRSGADSYAGCSAGEKARADLAIAMTLGDLAGFRASKKIPLRFIDEAFERVDDAGLDAIVRLLHSQSAQYETIFVVTHKSELKQLFDKFVVVTKEDGVSSIEDTNV